MHNTYTTQIETGTSVYGSDGEKIGDVAEVSNDYFVIEKGFIFTTDLFVPMSAIAGVDEDGVRLSMTKDQVENSDWSEAPVAGTVHDSDDTYVAGRADDTYARTDADVTDGDRLERREERLTVDKDTQQAGSVHVGKHVEEDVQSVDVPVTREEVTIDRHSVDRPAGGDAFTEDSIDVPVYEETVDVDKESRVVEELEVGKTARTDTAHVEETVRREEFDIDDETGTARRDR